MEYLEVSPSKAYTLLNPGGLVLLCSKSPSGRYDLAPVAWNCPLDYEPVSKVLLVCDTGHRTYEDSVASKEFAVALPTPDQRPLIDKSGSVSGREVDKYASFGIESRKASKVDALIPEGVAGWLECRLSKVYLEGTSAILIGEVVAASAVKDAWSRRLHFVSDGLWYTPGPRL